MKINLKETSKRAKVLNLKIWAMHNGLPYLTAWRLLNGGFKKPTEHRVFEPLMNALRKDNCLVEEQESEGQVAA